MIENTHPHGVGDVVHAGAALAEADKAIILLHGRGARALDIIRLADRLAPNDATIAFLAPQAVNNTWYPMSGFLPQDQLAPWLESALTVIDTLIDQATGAGVPATKIILGGFSQGAMLSLEYTGRGRRQIGGVIAFSGTLIGPVDQPHAPLADVSGLPIFLGGGTNDSWLPAGALEKTASLFTGAKANLDFRIYEGMDHIINEEEIEAARALIARV